MSGVPTVGSFQEIQVNLKALEKLLDSPDRQEHFETYKKKILKRAIHHIRYKTSTNKVAFAPSRFAGYKNFSMEQYSKRIGNGGEASDAVTRILECKPKENKDMDLEFIKFCNEYGFVPDNYKRKFWDYTKY